MKKIELTEEQLNKVISLRQVGASWLRIQRQTGINRRTAKRTYEKWEHSKSSNELKEARKDVATQAFREHMESLVALATSLVTNLNIPDTPDMMDKNAEQFFSGLFEQDLLGRWQQTTEAYASSSPRPIVDVRFYHREKEMLFESLKIHTREVIQWENILDNRWGRAKDNCAKIVHKVRDETSKVVNNYLKLERETNFLHRVEVESREDDPLKRMEEVVLRRIWQLILQDRLDEKGPLFETVLRGKGIPQEINVKSRDETIFTFFGDTNKSLAERVTRICNLACNNLCKGDTVRQLHDEVGNMEKASEELLEMLNPVRLRPMILRTRCDLCPA